MVRHSFLITAVLTGTALVMATDSSQAQERRFGRRARGDSYGYVPGGPQSGDIINYAPQTAGPAIQPNEVAIEVRVPADAEVLFEGDKTSQKGSVRWFVSPPINPERRYTYEIKAKWMENGREVAKTRKIAVRAGERLSVDLTKPAAETMPTDSVPVRERRFGRRYRSDS